jgi:hypothetical protein
MKANARSLALIGAIALPLTAHCVIGEHHLTLVTDPPDGALLSDGSTLQTGDASGPTEDASGRTDDAGGRSDGGVVPGAEMWLKLDDDPTDGVTDSTGHHTAACTTCPSLIEGVFGSSYEFGFKPDTAVVVSPGSEPDDLEPGLAFTLAAWVRIDAAPQGGSPVRSTALVCKSYPTDDCSYGFLVDSNLRLDFYTSGSHLYGTKELVLGTWHHLALTWDGATKIGYLGGEIAATTRPSAIPSSPAKGIVLGKDAANSLFVTFAGALDQVVFYKRVLTASEIWQLSRR